MPAKKTKNLSSKPGNSKQQYILGALALGVIVFGSGYSAWTVTTSSAMPLATLPATEGQVLGVSTSVTLLKNPNNILLMTVNDSEKKSAQEKSKYTVVKDIFKAWAQKGDDAALRPVYRLRKDGEGYLYTLYDKEKNDAQSVYKYTYEGIGFYAYPSAQAGTVPVYRLQRITNKAGARFIYTISTQERDALVASKEYSLNGIAFYAASTDGQQQAQRPAATYKVSLLTDKAGTLLMTIYDGEKKTAQEKFGYTLKKDVFKVWDKQSLDTKLKPVYRLQKASEGYLFTIYDTEKKSAQEKFGYTDGGVGFYAYPSAQTGTVPVYRLQRIKGAGARFTYTTSTQERDALVASKNFALNGVAFYVEAL